MEKSAFHQRGVVGGDIVDRRVLLWLMIRSADADDGHVDIGQQLFDFGIVIVGDDAIANHSLMFSMRARKSSSIKISHSNWEACRYSPTPSTTAVISFVGVK